MALSVVILAKNEEKNIQKALTSVKFADEILVVDDNSTDQTKDIAKKYKATVLHHELNGDFAGQRNWALQKAHGEWVLFLDADEEVTPELEDEFKHALTDARIVAYRIPRRDFFWNKIIQHGELHKVYSRGLIRLVKKNTGLFKGMVHEEFEGEGPIGNLTGYINHYPHVSIADFLHKVNTYSTLRARELLSHGKDASLFELIFFPFGKFFYTYFVLLGFLDGAAGFIYSFMMSFHSFLVRAKLFQYRYLSQS